MLRLPARQASAQTAKVTQLATVDHIRSGAALSRSIRDRRLRCLVAAFAGLAAPLLAHADDKDAFNIVAGVSVNHEDNLFRVSSAGNLPAGADKSDNVYGANVGVRFDKQYSLQRLQFDATATQYRFDKNSFLNFNGVNYRGAWLWHVTPRINGVLSASRSETLVPYSDYRPNGTAYLNRATQINENRMFTFDGEVTAAWHVIGGLGQSRSRNSQPFTAVGDYVMNGVEAGAKYVSTAGNSIALVQRESRGDYEGRPLLFNGAFLDTGFDQSETEARVLWRISGRSSLDGRLGYVKREYNNFGERNYNGAVGRLDYLWTPTGKLQVNVGVGRNLYSFQEASHSYYVADTFTVAPAWLLSDKTTLRVKFDHVERDFRGAVVAASPLREDRMQSLQFGADWKATRTILVQGTLSHERRTSNIANIDYRANVVGISGQLMF